MIQIPRKELKIRRARSVFEEMRGVWIADETVSTASSIGFSNIFLVQRAIGRLGENKRARAEAGSE